MVNDDDESFPPKGSDSKGGADGILGDALKKVLTTGIAAAFMTEEAIRSRVSELKLPKETLNLLLSGASKGRDELMNRVSNEVIRIINKIDFVKEASRFAEEHKFRVTAEIEVMKKDGSPNEGSIAVTRTSSSTPKHAPEDQDDV
jgi:hypothetical protein